MYNVDGINMYKIVCETSGNATTIFYGGRLECVYRLATLSRRALNVGYTVAPLCDNYILINSSVYYVKEVTPAEVLTPLKINPDSLDWDRNAYSFSKEARENQRVLRRRENS